MILCRLITPPSVTPVSIATAETELKIPAGLETSSIDLAIKTATNKLQRYTGRAFVKQSWQARLTSFPNTSGYIVLPPAPLLSVESINYYDSDSIAQIMDAADYEILGWHIPGRIRLTDNASWPTPRGKDGDIWINYTVGYDDDGGSPPDYTVNIPDDIKKAVLLMTGDLLNNREDSTPLNLRRVPQSSFRVLDDFRTFSGARLLYGDGL